MQWNILLIGYELGLTIAQLSELSLDEIGTWLAFIKRKNEIESKQIRNKNRINKPG